MPMISHTRRSLLLAACITSLLSPITAHALRAPIELCDVRTRFEGLPQNTLVLTFDACSGMPDQVLIEYLRENQMQCSIFVTGIFAKNHPDTLHAFVKNGWGLLNHGALHRAPIAMPGRLWKVQCAGSIEAVQSEVEEGASLLGTFRENAPRVYRGATALYDGRTKEWLARNHWDIGGYTHAADNGGRATSESVRAMAGKVRSGDVLLAHINHPERNNGVHLIELLQILAAQGFRFVSWEQASLKGIRVETISSWHVRLDS